MSFGVSCSLVYLNRFCIFLNSEFTSRISWFFSYSTVHSNSFVLVFNTLWKGHWNSSTVQIQSMVRAFVLFCSRSVRRGGGGGVQGGGQLRQTFKGSAGRDDCASTNPGFPTPMYQPGGIRYRTPFQYG